MEQESELSELDKGGEKMFFIHSRNSSISSMICEEDSAMLLQAEKKPVSMTRTKSREAEDSGDSSGERKRCKLSASGRCVCKISVVLYLATCITVSALYVAFFGKNQAFFGDAWIPGKVRESSLLK